MQIENDDAFPIAVDIAGADPVTAYVTLSDLAEIPANFRAADRLREALPQLVEFVNDSVNWAAITGIANALFSLNSGCLGHFTIYGIVRDWTDPLLETE